MAERHVIARTADIPEGGRLIVDVKGHSIGIFHLHGKYYALLNRCPHLGAELCRGDVVPLLESERPGGDTHDPSRPFLACPGPAKRGRDGSCVYPPGRSGSSNGATSPRQSSAPRWGQRLSSA